MTPRELELMNAKIDAAVEAAVRPLNAKISELQGKAANLEATDRKHSGIHRELGTKVVQTKSEVDIERTTLADALVLRDDRLVHVVNDIADRLDRIEKHGTTSIAPAAQGAEAAAVAGANAALRAEGQAKAIAVDTEAIARDQKKALAWWRHPAFPVVTYAIVDAAYRIWQAAHAP